MWFTKALARAFLAAPLIALPAAGANAAYPDKPVRIVVPFLAGGSIDVLARMTAQHLSAKLGQNFFVDNRAGAGGTIGADFVAKAAPDGYTLMFTAQGPLVINPFIMKQLPYEAKSAFAPVSVVVEAPNVLTARPGVPYRTFKDFLAFGKSHPDQMNFGSQGVGTTGHITAAMITQQTGLELTHVPYKGFPPMLTDVMTGRVEFMLADTLNVVARIRSKELVGIAVASKSRIAALPDVPTFAESGYSEILAGPWFSMLAPAGTSLELRQRLAGEVRQMLEVPEVSNKLKDMGLELRGSTPEEFSTFLDSEYKRWGDTIKAAGISVAE